MKKISIIIVNYKQVEVTVELLNSIHDICIYPDLEVILIDNEAVYGNELKFKSAFENLIYHPLNWNAGFAGANNIGAKLAIGEYLFFLNNDTIITSGVLNNMIYTLESHEHVGIVCPLIKYYDNPEKIQYAGFSKINPNTGRNKIKTKLEKNDIYETEYAHGAALFISKILYNAIGGFDEDYFLYYEELDLSAKVKKLGYRIMVNTKVFIYHKASISTGNDSPLKTYYLTRNRINFIRKNSSALEFRKFSLYNFFISTPINLVRLLLANQWKNMYYLLIGSKDGFLKISGFKKII